METVANIDWVDYGLQLFSSSWVYCYNFGKNDKGDPYLIPRQLAFVACFRLIL